MAGCEFGGNGQSRRGHVWQVIRGAELSSSPSLLVLYNQSTKVVDGEVCGGEGAEMWSRAECAASVESPCSRRLLLSLSLSLFLCALRNRE